MSLDEVINYLENLISHIVFEFEETSCGIDPLATNRYVMWCGDDVITVDSVEKAISTPFFKGVSFKNIIEKIEIQ